MIKYPYLQCASMVLISIFMWISCQVKIDGYNPTEGNPRYTVEGVVTDSMGYHYVRLSKVKNVTDNTPINFVDNAMVIVKGSEGIVDTFKYSTNGAYLPSKLWKGIPGNVYTLSISLPDLNISASDEMPNTPNFTIDSLKPVFRERATKQRINSLAYNDIFFTGNRYIQENDSVYRIRFFGLKNRPYRINVHMTIFRNRDIFKSNARFQVNNLEEFPIENFFIFPPPGDGPPQNVHFLSGDTVTVLLRGISNACYNYYFGLNRVLQFDGGIFSSPAGNPINNFKNDNIVGYFSASQITQKRVIVSFNGLIDK